MSGHDHVTPSSGPIDVGYWPRAGMESVWYRYAPRSSGAPVIWSSAHAPPSFVVLLRSCCISQCDWGNRKTILRGIKMMADMGLAAVERTATRPRRAKVTKLDLVDKSAFR